MANRSNKMVAKKISKKKLKVIIFGGSGFLGSHVAEVLHAQGHQVIIADIKKPANITKSIKFKKVDIKNEQKILNLTKNIDVVYNFAAIADIQESYNDPIKTFKINILGSAYILKSCVVNKVQKYVLASSIYADSSQGGFYRVSKQSCELMTEEYGKVFDLNFTILRYGSIYGPRSNLNNGLLKIVYDAIKKRKIIYRGTSKAVRSYIHVIDAAKASSDILNKKFNKKVVLIKGRKSVKIKKLLNDLRQITKIKSFPVFLNKTQKGHYDRKPRPFKKSKTINYFRPDVLNFKKGIIELIKIIKNTRF